MRLGLCALAVTALAAAPSIDAQIGRRPLFTLYTEGRELPGLPIDLLLGDNTLKPLGETDANGTFRFDPGMARADDFMAGIAMRCLRDKKPRVIVAIREAFGVPDNQVKSLFDFKPVIELGCKTQELPPHRFHEDYTGFIDPEVVKFTKGERRFPFDNSAAGYATLGGIGAGTILGIELANGDDPDTVTVTPGGNPPAGGLGDLLGLYDFTGTVQSRGNCVFNNFNSTVTFSGTAQAFSATMVETLTFPFAGTASFSNGSAQFTTGTSGSNPLLGGAYSVTFNGQILANLTATATETLTLSCGNVVVAQTGRRR